ncbi:MAG TPA: flagellar biosynthesis anti-sigma factor FlgM [Armatimonadota bacterium]|nr:flagellar biosynthesis anti-sigma factor FlgM [Armatimonadota bacterium]
MRIDGRHVIIQAHVHTVNERGEDAKQQQSAQPVPAQEDAVTLSPRAKEVQKVKQYLAAQPDVREDKVAEIRARLESGEYQVSAQELAERILQSGDLDLPEDLFG